MMFVAFGFGTICGLALALVYVAARRRAGDRSSDRADRQRAAEMADLARGLAHEIRNPLSTLKVNMELLAEDWREAQERSDPDLPRRSLWRLETLRSEAVRLDNTLEAFMRLTGRHELDLTRTDMNELLGHLVEFFAPQARGSNIQLRVSLADEALFCLVDTDLMQQALMNIVLNAQQAMPEGGELIVRSARGADGMARVDIADTGVGIAREVIDKIWQPYYSTRKGGSGLGLPTAERIVQEHQGQISVSSQLDRGTNFTIRLPLADD